jgi:hypothetical protein
MAGAIALVGALVGAGQPANAAAATNPVGAFDSAAGGIGAVTLGGWTYDPSTPGASTSVTVTVGGTAAGTLTAAGVRADVNRAKHVTGNHGYSGTLTTTKTGQQSVCVTAVNIGAGSNSSLGCKTVTIASAKPVGAFDSAVGGTGSVNVAGWTYDPDSSSTSTSVTVTVGGTAAGTLPATAVRSDVDRVKHITGNHGYSGAVPTGKTGPQSVCVTAVNIGRGANSTLGCKTVTITAPTTTPTPAPTTGVHVAGTQGHWRLTVNGAPYTVKGVTYDSGNGTPATVLPDIAGMGVNTIRTWDTDSSSAPLFDAASANGVHVIAGLWLDQNVDYATDTSYEATTLTKIKSTVTTYRNNPGLLMWDVGNEVMIGQSESERIAYAKYVEQVTDAIHALDPNHPVTSTDAWTGAWTYYQKYTPDLDLYAVNTYGGIGSVASNWAAGGYTKPYVVTETGPAGSWEVPNDSNGIPQQPTDTAAAQAYTNAWSDITGNPGVALGATMFNYGTQNDEQGVWLNLRTGGFKRLAYYAVERAYKGTVTGNTPPVIQHLTVTPTTGAAPGSPVTITVPAVDPDGDAVTYEVFETSKYINGDATMHQVTATTTGSGVLRIPAPATAGVWKLAVYALDGHGNAGIETASIRVG